MMNLMVTLSQKVSKMIGKANMPRRKLAGQRCSTMETIMNRMMRMIIARNNSRAQKMNHQKKRSLQPERKSKEIQKKSKKTEAKEEVVRSRLQKESHIARESNCLPLLHFLI